MNRNFSWDTVYVIIYWNAVPRRLWLTSVKHRLAVSDRMYGSKVVDRVEDEGREVQRFYQLEYLLWVSMIVETSIVRENV